MSVGSHICHSIPAPDSRLLQGGSPPIATREKFLVGIAQVSIDDGFAFCIESTGAPREFHWGQGDLHASHLRQTPRIGDKRRLHQPWRPLSCSANDYVFASPHVVAATFLRAPCLAYEPLRHAQEALTTDDIVEETAKSLSVQLD